MGILLGVDYYPEQWPEEMWEQDADHMKECGVKLVRMAEFAWSRLEPEEGDFRFEWLDHAVSVFKGFRYFCVHQPAPLRCGHLRNILRSFRLEQTEEGSPSESVDTAA